MRAKNPHYFSLFRYAGKGPNIDGPEVLKYMAGHAIKTWLCCGGNHYGPKEDLNGEGAEVAHKQGEAVGR